MRKPIEFNESGTGIAPDSKDSQPQQQSSFRSVVFGENYWKLQQKFTQALTWLRFFPAIRGSEYSWMLKVDIYRDKGGVTFVSPTTLDNNAVDPFRQASTWLRKNKPDALYKRDVNEGGLKLWPTPFGAAWCIDDGAESGSKLRIFFASMYDGVRGGTAGLAHNVLKAANECDNEPGSPTIGQRIHGDITDPATGRLVRIDRSKGASADYASYSCGIGKSPAPLSALVDKLTDEEHDLLIPIEKAIHIPTTDEVHGYLKGYIGEELHKQIFAK